MKIKLTPKHLIGIGVAVIVVVAFIYIIGDKNTLREQAEYWKGKYEAERIVVTELEKNNLKENDLLMTKIAELQGHIDSANTVIANISEEDKTKAERITALEDALKHYPGTAQEIIDNQAQQIDLWKQRFTLAERIIKEKDDIIFDLTIQYEAQVEISLNFEQLYLSGKELIKTGETRIGILEKENRSLHRSVKLRNVVIGAVAAGIVYSLVK